MDLIQSITCQGLQWANNTVHFELLKEAELLCRYRSRQESRRLLKEIPSWFADLWIRAWETGKQVSQDQHVVIGYIIISLSWSFLSTINSLVYICRLGWVYRVKVFSFMISLMPVATHGITLHLIWPMYFGCFFCLAALEGTEDMSHIGRMNFLILMVNISHKTITDLHLRFHRGTTIILPVEYS